MIAIAESNLDSDSDEDNDEGVTEFDNYLGMKRDRTVTNPINWWKKSNAIFPKMARWARDVFAVPSTGCGVEREFSISGRIVTKQRNRLVGSTISDIMQYKRWCARNGDLIEEAPLELEMDCGDNTSEVGTEFDERNSELEDWLEGWTQTHDIAHVVKQFL